MVGLVMRPYNKRPEGLVSLLQVRTVRKRSSESLREHFHQEPK